MKIFSAVIGICLMLFAAACQQSSAPEEVIPPLVVDAPAQHAHDALAALESAEPPSRDLADLAKRLKGIDVSPSEPAVPNVGDVEPFWYLVGGDANTEAQAELRMQTDNLNIWIEEGIRVSDSKLQEAVDVLENEIVPTNRAFFGREKDTPGDPRINILHLASIGGSGGSTVIAGYFSAADFYPQAANEFSNERKILYISQSASPIGSVDYYQVVAHELEHMIQATVDVNEATWIDEGMAELAAYVNGYPEVDSAENFTAMTDVQLNNWSNLGTSEDLAHYGASFLFSAYFLERFGSEAMQRLVQQQENGFSGVREALADLGESLTVNELFADWTAATYLASIQRDEDRWDYGEVSMPAVELSADHASFPIIEMGGVSQYGTDYIRVESDEPVTFEFTGSQQTTLMPVGPIEGDNFVTTYPADRSDMHMTRAFDLTAVDVPTITLSFQTWYEIETGWDYGYVLVSADDGASWDMLGNKLYFTEANPQGNNYGTGITGKSGIESEAVWAEVNVDLSAYAGHTILLRFEYVTDDAVFEAGWAIDDVRIPVLDYSENFEEGLGGWQLAGWARHSNVLPQSYLLQAVYVSDDAFRVEPLQLDDTQQGSFQLQLDDQFNQVVLIVSGSTPVTKQRTAYRYSLSR